MLKQTLGLVVVGASIWLVQPSGVVAADNESKPTIPYRADERKTSSQMTDVLSILILLVGAGIAGVYCLKRYFPHLHLRNATESSRLKVLSSVRLNARASLYLCEVDGSSFLIAQSGDSISIVRPRTPPTPPA